MGLSCGLYEGQTLARAVFGGGSATVAHAGPGSAAGTDSDHIRCFHLISFDRTWAVFYARAWQPDSFGRVFGSLVLSVWSSWAFAGDTAWLWWVFLSFFLGGGERFGSERLIALLRQSALFLFPLFFF